jgi:hypothetical protein
MLEEGYNFLKGKANEITEKVNNNQLEEVKNDPDVENMGLYIIQATEIMGIVDAYFALENASGDATVVLKPHFDEAGASKKQYEEFKDKLFDIIGSVTDLYVTYIN